ncbi:glycosyl hydrolase family 95 catalytic domain-containing protein [Alloscardovia macacae]|uniref:Alpha-galactosidase n=1 Tax=Alloscardovia macacae TaxID=1160091 RepID=A0A261F5G4_9BIFI|nr:glycoside hydrolase N-terminal domain-containing protein [Alloscardovia macacae]OZG54338.1 alpha-galactosidase [Alloscardovia macacae]
MKMLWHGAAQHWNDGIPLGSGRMGAMVYGADEQITFALNEDTLWSGYPNEDVSPLNARDMEDARKLLRDGLVSEANELINSKLSHAHDVQVYLPLGDMHLRFEAARTDVQRSLDLDDATMRECFSLDDTAVKVEAWCSRKTDELIVKVDATGLLNCTLSADGGFITHVDAQREKLCIRGQAPGLHRRTLENADDTLWNPENVIGEGMGYAAVIRYEVAEGQVQDRGNSIAFSDIQHLTLRVRMRTGYRGHNVSICTDSAQILTELLTVWKEEHAVGDAVGNAERDAERDAKDEYDTLFRRTRICLGTADEEESAYEYDVARLLESVAQGSEDALARCVQMLFSFGKYLALSGSRLGAQAMTLQGLWNNQKVPPWFSDYTTNINTEMNYWLVGPCQLGDVIEPLEVMSEQLICPGRKTARDVFGCGGSAVCHNVDIWRKSTPAHGDALWALYPYAHAWICATLYDTYLYTRDAEYLERIWPSMCATAQFCMDALVEKDDGYLAPCGAISPENQFYVDDTGAVASVASYTEHALALTREACRNLCEAYEHLCSAGKDTCVSEDSDTCAKVDGKAFVTRARGTLPRLVPPRIRDDGAVQEWDSQYKEVDPQHRHLSHLYEVYPGRGSDERLEKAARVTLEQRGDDGSGWSIVWRMLLWSRLRDSQHVLNCMRLFLRRVDAETEPSIHGGGVYGSGLCAHPPFQIDGNLGFSAACMQMLVDSTPNSIRILPAWPCGGGYESSLWSRGSVCGAGTRTGLTVDVHWDSKEVVCSIRTYTQEEAQSLRVLSEKGERVSVRYAEEEMWITYEECVRGTTLRFKR